MRSNNDFWLIRANAACAASSVSNFCCMFAIASVRSVSSSEERFSFRERVWRSEEHTSELQSLMRISYAVFCLKKKKNITAYSPKCDCKPTHNRTHYNNYRANLIS